MKHNYLIIFILSFVTACADNHAKLETALRLAGDNRPELERVLAHYSHSPADSLKLRAARFLIENMPGHYTLDGNLVNAYRRRIDSDTSITYFTRKVSDIALAFVKDIDRGARKLEDVRHIKADYLIHHIDRSFEKRDEYPWVGNLPFDDFLEYVLPYRQQNERLDYWIDSLRMDSVSYGTVMNVDYLRYDVWNQKEKWSITMENDENRIPFMVRLLRNDTYKDCRVNCELAFLCGKVLGFPAAVDGFPYYANRNGFHYWNVTRSPEIVGNLNRGPVERKAAKVYRHVFARQHDLDKERNAYIPEWLKDPFNKDVTDEYLYTATVSVRAASDVSPDTPYAYLAVFNKQGWRPIAIASLKHGKSVFPSMGKGVLYRPVYYHDKTMRPLDCPFILNTDGTTTPLVPDTLRRIAARLERKYPTSADVYNYTQVLTRHLLIASVDARFLHPDTLADNVRLLKTRLEIKPDTARHYRYWRLRLATGETCGEVAFYDVRGNLLKGIVDSANAAGFDGDPLTNLPGNPRDYGYVTVDFGRPVAVSRVVLLPRSDGNGIYPGDEYELFYHDLDGWQSLGRRVATDYFLDYDNLPADALYWLHNHTRGVEERPFTITPSGDIRFW